MARPSLSDEVTSEMRQLVELLASIGVTQDWITKALSRGFPDVFSTAPDRKTLRKYFKTELKAGKESIISVAKIHMVRKVMQGDDKWIMWFLSKQTEFSDKIDTSVTSNHPTINLTITKDAD